MDRERGHANRWQQGILINVVVGVVGAVFGG